MLGTHGTYSRSSSSEGSESTAGTPTMRFATVLLNGLQMIKCRMPDAWRTASVTVPAEEVNMTGDRGGLGLDVLLMIPTAQSAPRASETPRDEWKVTLTAACICEADGSETKQTVELGSLRYDTAVAQTGCYLTSPPKEYTVTLHHQLATHYFPPVEQQLVRDIESSLRDPKLARPDSGSLSSVLLNNKVKKSVSYERVVKDTYQSSWLDFIRAHSRVFHVFFYSEEQIKDGNLAPQIKKGDARVCLRGVSEEDVYEVDCLRCRQQKKADEGTRAFLAKSLSLGAMSQVDLVEKLKGCKPFADALHPTFSLLMRFVARHASTFVWISDPDQPTRIGLAGRGRFPHHELPSVFLSAAHLMKPCSLPPRTAAAFTRMLTPRATEPATPPRSPDRSSVGDPRSVSSLARQGTPRRSPSPFNTPDSHRSKETDPAYPSTPNRSPESHGALRPVSFLTIDHREPYAQALSAAALTPMKTPDKSWLTESQPSLERSESIDVFRPASSPAADHMNPPYAQSLLRAAVRTPMSTPDSNQSSILQSLPPSPECTERIKVLRPASSSAGNKVKTCALPRSHVPYCNQSAASMPPSPVGPCTDVLRANQMKSCAQRPNLLHAAAVAPTPFCIQFRATESASVPASPSPKGCSTDVLESSGLVPAPAVNQVNPCGKLKQTSSLASLDSCQSWSAESAVPTPLPSAGSSSFPVAPCVFFLAPLQDCTATPTLYKPDNFHVRSVDSVSPTQPPSSGGSGNEAPPLGFVSAATQMKHGVPLTATTQYRRDSTQVWTGDSASSTQPPPSEGSSTEGLPSAFFPATNKSNHCSTFTAPTWWGRDSFQAWPDRSFTGSLDGHALCAPRLPLPIVASDSFCTPRASLACSTTHCTSCHTNRWTHNPYATTLL